MRKIINGLKYFTDTAQYQAEATNGYGMGDFNWCKETLYRKKTGEYFLHGEGGGLSEYAEYLPGYNSYTSGEKIIPLSYEDAKSWAEDNLEVDEYERIFGYVTEGDEEDKVISVRLDPNTKQNIDLLRSKLNCSMAEIVDKAIDALIEKENL